MEYMAMLEEPGMVAGLQELIDDPDPSVAKRTIRVFTNVYRHSLSLLASGELDPDKYEKSYSEINNVSNQLIDMLKSAENEGIAIHLVRYLEAALVSHILSDLSKHPHIAKMTAPMLKKGVTALLDLVKTPYVGGSAFCVAIRALITVACYQVDMRPIVTNVVELLIASPPPNLFDHNVRSFHKTLQRNLFRLLKRAEEADDKEKLIDLMVRVGVPRKRLTEWAPRVSRKRPSPSSSRNKPFVGSNSPPVAKKRKITEEEIIRFSPNGGSKILSPQSSGRSSPLIIDSNPERETVLNPTAALILDQILSGGKLALPIGMSSDVKTFKTLNTDRKSSAGRKSPLTEVSNTMIAESVTAGRKSPADSQPKLSPRQENQLGRSPSREQYSPNQWEEYTPEREIPGSRKETANESEKLLSSSNIQFTDRCSPKEKEIYCKIGLTTVVDMIIHASENVPNETPAYLPKVRLEELDTMKEKLSILLANIIPDDLFYKTSPSCSDERSSHVLSTEQSVDLLDQLSSRRRSSPSSKSSAPSSKSPPSSSKSPPSSSKSPPSSSKSSALSMRSASPPSKAAQLSSSSDKPFSSQDVDLRQRTMLYMQDVDMRNLISTRDPRVNRTSSSTINSDPRSTAGVTVAAPITRDPRLSASAGKVIHNPDPRLKLSHRMSPKLDDTKVTPATTMSTTVLPPPMFSRPPPSLAAALQAAAPPATTSQSIRDPRTARNPQNNTTTPAPISNMHSSDVLNPSVPTPKHGSMYNMGGAPLLNNGVYDVAAPNSNMPPSGPPFSRDPRMGGTASSILITPTCPPFNVDAGRGSGPVMPQYSWSEAAGRGRPSMATNFDDTYMSRYHNRMTFGNGRRY